MWVAFTLIGAAAQTARNSMQKELTTTLGTVGATHVRFLYGLPFALLFLGLISIFVGTPPSILDPAFLVWTAAGGMTQIIATGLLLAAMRMRSFVVAITYSKIEPVFVLLFAAIFLQDLPTHLAAAGVFIATSGVVAMSWPAKGAAIGAFASTAMGLGSGAGFALSAVFYRGGILDLPDGSFVVNASTTLCVALAVQSATITAYLLIADRAVLRALLASWRASAPAGFCGAFASQFWFLAFAVQSASLVRALALVEIVFAQIISRRIFRQSTSAKEYAGIGLITAGVLVILLGSR